MTHWRKVAKQVAYWTVPPGFWNLLRPMLIRGRHANSSDLKPAEEHALLEKNSVLRNSHSGQRCFILATGPSIKSQDLKFLQGETCIAVSNFFVHPDYHLLRPRYYCIVPYHPLVTEEAWQKWMEEIEGGTDGAVMFFGLADRQRNRHNGMFADRQVHYLKFGGTWEPLLAHGVDLARAVPGPQSVPVMALLVALYMGFQTIYLLGCDHDWILHINTSSHFYDEKCHALNRWGFNEWYGVDFESECQTNLTLWQQYKAIRQIASKQSTQIYNATDGGLLDVFPRVKFKSLFDQETHENLSEH